MDQVSPRSKTTLCRRRERLSLAHLTSQDMNFADPRALGRQSKYSAVTDIRQTELHHNRGCITCSKCAQDPASEVYRKALDMTKKAPELHAELQRQLAASGEVITTLNVGLRVRKVLAPAACCMHAACTHHCRWQDLDVPPGMLNPL